MGTYTATGIVTLGTNTMGASVVGAASIEAALSDNSDASYVTCNNFTSGELIFTLPTPVLPANCVVRGLTWELRRSVTAGASNPNPFAHYKILAAYPGGPLGPPGFHGRTHDAGAFTQQLVGTSIQNSGTGWFDVFPDGFHINDMQRNGIAISLGTLAANIPGDLRLYRVRTIWYYDEQPVVTIGAYPANPSLTSRPDITYTYSDPDGSPLRSWRAMIVPADATTSIFPYGYAGGPSFNPEGASEIAFDSGMQYNPLNFITSNGLENNRTYWAYVRAYSDPIAGVPQMSQWTGKQFTVTVVGPAVPTFTVTADPANGRAVLHASESTTAAPHPTHYDIERSEDGGDIWWPVRNGTFTATSAGIYHPGGALSGGWGATDRPEFTFANGLRARWNGTLADYTPAATAVLLGQYRSSVRSWKLLVRTDGKLELQWSSTGANWDRTATSTASAGLVNGSQVWIEVEAVFNTNPVTVIFRVSTNGTTWTSVGATVTGAGPQLANNSTGILDVGLPEGSVSAAPVGTTLKAQVWNSAGQLVADGDWVGLAPVTTTFTDPSGAIWSDLGNDGHLRMVFDGADYEATNGVPVTYRARAYRTYVDGHAASDWVEADPVTLSAARWWIKDPIYPERNMPVSMVEWSRTIPKPMTVSDGIDSYHAIVVHGGLRSERIQARLRTLSIADYNRLGGLLADGSTLLVQGVLGAQWYVQCGEINLEIVHASPEPSEPFPIRHAHEFGVVFVEVEAP